MSQQRRNLMFVGLLLVLATTIGGAGVALAQAPAVTPPQPTVPEVFSIQGQFVRVAYNNEGYATLGYRIANQEVGNEWMMLDVGITLRDGTKDQTLTRAALTVTTPDGKKVPLASQEEFMKAGYLRALTERAKMSRDSINYFPAGVSRPCALRFFAPAGKVAYDQVSMDSQQACVGQLFFKIPGGIQTGQHWLNIQFAGSEVQVPFRILTKEEDKQFSKTWEDLKKQLDEAMQGE